MTPPVCLQFSFQLCVCVSASLTNKDLDEKYRLICLKKCLILSIKDKDMIDTCVILIAKLDCTDVPNKLATKWKLIGSLMPPEK